MSIALSFQTQRKPYRYQGWNLGIIYHLSIFGLDYPAVSIYILYQMEVWLIDDARVLSPNIAAFRWAKPIFRVFWRRQSQRMYIPIMGAFKIDTPRAFFVTEHPWSLCSWWKPYSLYRFSCFLAESCCIFDQQISYVCNDHEAWRCSNEFFIFGVYNAPFSSLIDICRATEAFLRVARLSFKESEQ